MSLSLIQRLFTEINEIFLKIYSIPILTFIYLVTLYQKTELETISSQLKLEFNSSLWQIIVAHVGK